MFVTSTGLVVGYVGEGAAGRGVIVGGGGVSNGSQWETCSGIYWSKEKQERS